MQSDSQIEKGQPASLQPLVRAYWSDGYWLDDLILYLWCCLAVGWWTPGFLFRAFALQLAFKWAMRILKRPNADITNAKP